MAKVTSKLQVTVPKALALELDIRPGSEIEWLAAGDSLRIVPAKKRARALTCDVRLKLFDQATDRLRGRTAKRRARKPSAGRGWTRDELYRRGRAR